MSLFPRLWHILKSRLNRSQQNNFQNFPPQVSRLAYIDLMRDITLILKAGAVEWPHKHLGAYHKASCS